MFLRLWSVSHTSLSWSGHIPQDIIRSLRWNNGTPHSTKSRMSNLQGEMWFWDYTINKVSYITMYSIHKNKKQKTEQLVESFLNLNLHFLFSAMLWCHGILQLFCFEYSYYYPLMNNNLLEHQSCISLRNTLINYHLSCILIKGRTNLKLGYLSLSL